MDGSENNRKMKRMRALKGARYIVDSFVGCGIDCTIIDIHSEGARIRFTDPVTVKDRFELVLFPESIRVTARKVWQRGNQFGVEFDQPLSWLARHDRSLGAAAR